MYINKGFGSSFEPVSKNGFGVDKLKLFTTDFEISSVIPWNIVPNRKKAGQESAEEIPLFVSGGKVVNGEKAYINGNGYNMTIHNGKLFVEFNPSNHYHPHELTADPNRIADFMAKIQQESKEVHRIGSDLFTAGLGRLDITAQAEMDNLVPDYKDIVSGGKKSLRFRKTDYPNGHLSGNDTRQICTYDKGMKLQIDQQLKNIMSTNFQRIETRLLKAEAVKTHSQFKNVSHLLNCRPDQLHHAYFKSVHQILNIGQTEIEFIEMNVLTDLVRTAIQTNKQGQWLLFVAMTLADRMPSVDQFTETLKRLETENIVPLSTRKRLVKQYSELKHKTDFARSRYIDKSANSYADRYKEFTEKLILPYRTAL